MKLFSRIIALCRLLPVIGSLCYLPVIAQTSIVTVDGLTGTVTDQNWNNGIFYPGDEVMIKIVKADLLHYSYSVVMERIAIERIYYVNGVPGGTLTDPALTTLSLTSRTAIPAKAAGTNKTDCGKEYRESIDPYLKIIDKTVDSISAFARTIDSIDRDVALVMKDEGKVWKPERVEEVLRFADSARKRLDSAIFQYQIMMVLFPCGQDECCEQIRAQLTTVVAAKVTAVTSVLTAQVNLLQSWLQIMRTNPPVIEHTFRIEDTPKRYIATITRRPIQNVEKESGKQASGTANKKSNESAVAESDASGNSKSTSQAVDASLAVVAFEGHTYSTFVFAIGFAGHLGNQTVDFTPFVKHSKVYDPIYRGDTIPEIRRDSIGVDSLFYRLHEREAQIVITPMVMLGVYLGGVDDLKHQKDYWADPWDWKRIFVFVGADVAFPPKQYFLGANYDFPIGMAVGGGVTWRRVETIGDVWSANSTDITQATKTTIGSAPMDARSEITPFVNVAFRPVFLSTLFGMIKKWVSS
jgi:hypothetical protein